MKPNAVEQLINRLRIEYKKQDRSGVYGYTQRNLAFNSNKIEGSTLTSEQTSSLFDTGTLKSDGMYFRAKDVEETTGHFLMFNTMFLTYNDELTEDLIKKYHNDLKSGVFEDKANGYPIGEYKNRANMVSNIKTVLPQDVDSEMKKLLTEYNSKDKISLEDIVMFHAKYESIHPFQDGNGRTGRIIIYKECLKNNIFPLIIKDENKQEYYDCLNIAQTENNYKSLHAFFEKEQREYYNAVEDMIYEYESESAAD